MRCLIWIIKSAFCNHKWNYEEVQFTITDNYGKVTKNGTKVSATCKECGWHRKYWKHN